MTATTAASSAAALFVLGRVALAVDFPPAGNAEYDTYYVLQNLVTLDSGAASSGVDLLTGITRNVAGFGPFHDMSVECVRHWTLIDNFTRGNGSCVETDRDGDNVFSTFDGQTHTLRAGTGKYKGITGQAPYAVVELRKTVGGRGAVVVRHAVSWAFR